MFYELFRSQLYLREINDLPTCVRMSQEDDVSNRKFQDKLKKLRSHRRS